MSSGSGVLVSFRELLKDVGGIVNYCGRTIIGLTLLKLALACPSNSFLIFSSQNKTYF
jgi:hypothetical protein